MDPFDVPHGESRLDLIIRFRFDGDEARGNAIMEAAVLAESGGRYANRLALLVLSTLTMAQVDELSAAFGDKAETTRLLQALPRSTRDRVIADMRHSDAWFPIEELLALSSHPLDAWVSLSRDASKTMPRDRQLRLVRLFRTQDSWHFIACMNVFFTNNPVTGWPGAEARAHVTAVVNTFDDELTRQRVLDLLVLHSAADATSAQVADGAFFDMVSSVRVDRMVAADTIATNWPTLSAVDVNRFPPEFHHTLGGIAARVATAHQAVVRRQHRRAVEQVTDAKTEDPSVQCKLCMENAIRVTCLPCAHASMCGACYHKLQTPKCPTCRANIVSIQARQRIEQEIESARRAISDEEKRQTKLQLEYQTSEVAMHRLQAKLVQLQRLLDQLSR